MPVAASPSLHGGIILGGQGNNNHQCRERRHGNFGTKGTDEEMIKKGNLDFLANRFEEIQSL